MKIVRVVTSNGKRVVGLSVPESLLPLVAKITSYALQEPQAPTDQAPTDQAPAVDYSTEFQMAPLTEPLVHANGGPRSDSLRSFDPPTIVRP